MGYYVVIDLEMCRVPKTQRKHYRNKQEIIQIGAALMDSDLNVIDTYSEYVKPEYGNLDNFISKLTGITAKDLENAVNIKIALDKFMNWLPQDDVVIPVSWSNSDEYQFRYELSEKKITTSDRFDQMLFNWIDCQPQFAKKMRMKKQYSLEEALIATDICTDGRAHNGMVDAYNTALLYVKMQNEDELVLNEYYRRAHCNEEPEHLSFGLDDLLVAAGF